MASSLTSKASVIAFASGSSQLQGEGVPRVQKFSQSHGRARCLAVRARRDEPKSPRDRRLSRERAAFAAAALATLASTGEAKAVEGQDVVDALEKAEAFAKGTATFLVKAFEVSKDVAEKVYKVAKPAVEAAAPVVKDAAQSAFEAATPVVAEGASKAVKFLEDQGLNLEPVVKASQTASEVTNTVVTEATVVQGKVQQAIEFAQPAITFLTSQSPPILAAEAGALVLFYLSIPSILGAIVYSFRGFAGTLTPAQAFDKLIQEDFTLVDVRSEEDKENSGVPDLPRNARRKPLFVPIEEVDQELRPKLKNPRALEAELTAIKVASLKKLGKGSKVIIIDSKGDIAKIVAKSLSSLGYRNTFVVQDGIDGPNGWANGQLPLEFYESKAEYLTPATLLSGALGGSGGTTKVTKEGGSSKVKLPESRPGLLLPSGRSEEGDE